MSNSEKIIVKGARTHNLKNITVELPRNKLIVFTGLSGSGKSSLAFDTIFAEGQRRYMESLSAYARQFLRQMQKPDVDEIIGLSPAISIDQKSRGNNPRSTVATITEIYDYLRVLFARVGRPHCLICGRRIQKLSAEEMRETILGVVRGLLAKKTDKNVLGVAYNDLRLKLYAPMVVGRKGEYYQLLYDLLSKGYQTVRIDGFEKNLREQIILEKHKKHDIDVLVDEYFLTDLAKEGEALRERFPEAVERALHESDGLLRIEIPSTEKGGEPLRSSVVSAKFMCPYDGFSYPEIEPRLFSFNSPYGACPECHGLGTRHFFGEEPCPRCLGKRLREEALHVRIGAKRVATGGKASGGKNEEGFNIVEVASLSIADAYDFFIELELSLKEKEIAKTVLREIESRLQFMVNVGIEYLTLDRRAHTLSGGEAQRIRLASQLGSGLVGALYVLDEPTIGLHARDNARLIKTLQHLRDIGNTIIVVEHDEETILSSDYLVDIGPGAGVHGGQIVVSGDLSKLMRAKSAPGSGESLTLAYLRGDKEIEIPKERKAPTKGYLRVRGAHLFNIRNQDADIPLGAFVAITGVSGSGKSTFLYEILHRNLQARFEKRHRSPNVYNARSFIGAEYLSRAILIDQSPIGRTPRSNPATYTGAWTFIRELLAESEEAKVRGWNPNRFSFNVKGGRCEACQGNGEIAVEMHFLPTVYVSCDVCGGKRFMKETLEVKFKRKSVYDILCMTIEEALSFFEDIPAVHDRLQTLCEVGLGYLGLGQSATTLSGGEAERVKISSELYRRHVEKTIYLLDEPTVGLHYEDVRKLIEILQRLVDSGNTVLVIEHNMDVIKSADYIIDFGPEGGDDGGRIVAKGTPEEVAEKDTHTGEFLRKTLRGRV